MRIGTIMTGSGESGACLADPAVRLPGPIGSERPGGALQRRHGGQWFKGKGSIDGTVPLGPWIALSDEIDMQRVMIEFKLNATVMQRAGVSDMAFPSMSRSPSCRSVCPCIRAIFFLPVLRVESAMPVHPQSSLQRATNA